MTIENVAAKAVVTGLHSIMNIVSVNNGTGWNVAPFVQTTTYVKTKETKMNEDNKMMARYEITSTSKVIYSYKQHRYEKIEDALRYAEIDSIRTQESDMSKR